MYFRLVLKVYVTLFNIMRHEMLPSNWTGHTTQFCLFWYMHLVKPSVLNNCSSVIKIRPLVPFIQRHFVLYIISNSQRIILKDSSTIKACLLQQGTQIFYTLFSQFKLNFLNLLTVKRY